MPNLRCYHFRTCIYLLSIFAECVQQPTAFDLEIISLSEIFQNKELFQAFHSHIGTKTKEQGNGLDVNPDHADKSPKSKLLLKISATADYYSSNETLMKDAPNVNVDISKQASIQFSFILLITQQFWILTF